MSPPRIGINCDVAAEGQDAGDVRLTWPYVEAVMRAGGVPLLLAPVPESLIGALLDGLDGLVLSGGRDYDPALYGQACHPATRLLHRRRNDFDVALAREALARGLPTLGVCGGAQLINVALGGSLVQDIPSQIADPLLHARKGSEETFHTVEVDAGSRLARIVEAGQGRPAHGRLEVNSSHHQAVDRLGEGLRIVARAPDGIVEAVEGTGEAFLLGVQWHPERILEREEQLALFRALVMGR